MCRRHKFDLAVNGTEYRAVKSQQPNLRVRIRMDVTGILGIDLAPRLPVHAPWERSGQPGRLPRTTSPMDFGANSWTIPSDGARTKRRSKRSASFDQLLFGFRQIGSGLDPFLAQFLPSPWHRLPPDCFRLLLRHLSPKRSCLQNSESRLRHAPAHTLPRASFYGRRVPAFCRLSCSDTNSR